MNSWLYLFLVVIGYIAFIGMLLSVSVVLRKQIDRVTEKYEKEHKDSVEILSNVSTNDRSCNIEKVFCDLENSNIDISCDKMRNFI